MPTPTEQLQRLLTKGATSLDFKQSAMALARQGADITVRGKADAEPTLLHALAHHNEGGVNNDDIAELVALNAAALASKDYYGRTALQSIIDAFTNKQCSFDNFKQSAMALARQGADITVRGRADAEPALLHVLAHHNAGGVNNDDIAELVALNAAALASKDYYGRTALQSIIDAFTNKQCSFDNFKQSAMALARQGADITVRGKADAEPALLHVLAHHNAGGVNNDDIAELVALNAAALASKDYYGRTALQSIIDAFTNKQCSFDNFKQSAMALARQGADITVRGKADAEPTLLHVLAHHNAGGVNNDDIAELVALNAAALESKDYYGRTALQSLIDTFTNKKCSFDYFKQSAMVLARQGADITVRGKADAEPTLLHVLAHHNEGGVNNDDIAELVALNAATLESKDYYGRTALQSLIDTFTNKKCSFDYFKQSAMVLARQGADITVRGKADAEPTLLHVLAHHNEGGVNNDDIAELVALNAATLESKDYYGRTPAHYLLCENPNIVN